MVKFYVSLLLLGSIRFFGQSFSYLNASTANWNEFPVDKDTNIYMFHGSRLVKTDKHFNTVWANTYSGISAFTRILLSKTGSIYCAGSTNSTGSAFGRINPDGTIAWLKTADFTCTKLMLDRNDNLVVTGAQGCFVKLDTNGNFLKYKQFGTSAALSYLDGFSIVEDSAGYYKFVGVGHPTIGPARALAMHYYDDNTDSFARTRPVGGLGVPTDSDFGWKLITSKFSDRFYVQTTLSGTSSVFTEVRKFTTSGKLSWTGTFFDFHGTRYTYGGHVEESNDGYLLCTVTTGNSLADFTSAFVKVDSSGVASPSAGAVSMLHNYFIGTTWPPPVHAPRVIHGNNYYFDISGQNLPDNPLTVQKFNSSLSYSCSATVSVSYGYALGGSSVGGPISTQSIITGATLSLTSHSTAVTPVSFSVNQNFCTVVETDELLKDNAELKMFPSPAKEKLHLSETADLIEVFDVDGRKLKTGLGTSFIDVADLSQGIYFIRVKAGQGEWNGKFLKE